MVDCSALVGESKILSTILDLFMWSLDPGHGRVATERGFKASTVIVTVLFLLSLEAPVSLSFVTPHVRLNWKRTSFLPVQALQTPDTELRRDAATDSAGSNPISLAQLHELKESVDIVSAIESYGLKNFQRRGEKSAVALCPFHDDHSPSLSIDGNRKIFKCFACGAGGDIFKFAQKYNNLQGIEMSFFQAVCQVAEKCSDQVIFPTSWNDQERYNSIQAKKDRILLANAAAALFYADNLVSLPAAGRARSHLRSRGLSPSTVRIFTLGYAPDAYFQSNQPWGSGSLVNHLLTLGFSAEELVEAGLVIRTTHLKMEPPQETKTATPSTESVMKSENDSLMDRFRGRLMVPIFDAKGEHVLGFGGRILTNADEEPKAGFKAPKYLNSPESLVFQKKYTLFGQHTVKLDVQSDRNTIIVVEGYMDAISLWDAGIHEVVASMGTALTREQLTAAAKVVGGNGGQIILCLDADEAGVSALERLCSSGILRSVVESSGVEILIATLPDGIKDPSEFVELKRERNKQVGDEFRDTVMSLAEEWTTWYIGGILTSCSSPSKLGNVRLFDQSFEIIAEFLSTFPNPAERIRLASDVASALAEIMAKEANATKSTAVRIQLEADLIDSVSRKAVAKEALERRIESVAYSGNITSSLSLSQLSAGMTASTEESGKLSTKALSNARPKGGLSKIEDPPPRSKSIRSKPNRRAFKESNSQSSTRENNQLTPHFSGLEFENKFDAEWMDLSERKRDMKNLVLGASIDSSSRKRPGESNFVYFNSNSYHGRQLLTEAAISAGYLKTPMQRDLSIFEKGVSSLLKLDPDTSVLAAEERLLRILINNRSARSVMKRLLDAKSTAGAKDSVDWSSPEREWLVSHLLSDLPDDLTIDELRLYLSKLPDTPKAAFTSANEATKVMEGTPFGKRLSLDQSSEQSQILDSSSLSSREDFRGLAVDVEGTYVTENDLLSEIVQPELENESSLMANRREGSKTCAEGCLDYLFAVDQELTGAFEQESTDQLRIELCVQESLTTLRWALAQKKASEALNLLMASDNSLARTNLENGATPSQESSPIILLNKPGGQDEGITTQATEVFRSLLSAQELWGSAKRMASKLLDVSNADVREGHVSSAQRREIELTLNEINQGFKGVTAVDVESDDESEESVDGELERMDEEWGEWADDNFEWSPGTKSTSSWALKTEGVQMLASYDDEVDEPVEDTLARIDSEWENWKEPEDLSQ